MSKMRAFIAEQPDALRRALAAAAPIGPLAAAFSARRIRKAWLLGSGTSLFAAMIAAAEWERVLGLDAEAVSALEFADLPAGALGEDVAVVGVSQSGASFVLVEGVARARAAGCLTVGVTAEPRALIGGAAEFVVPTDTGPEDAMGKTKGFTTTAFATCRLAHLIAGRHDEAATFAGFPEAVAATVARAEAEVERWVALLRDTRAIFAVGSGAFLPAAWEGGLKVLEVAKQVVVTKELEEMLHGPFNAVGPDSAFILMAGAIGRRDRLDAFLKAVAALDLPLLTIADARTPVPAGTNAASFTLPDLGQPALEAILAVVPLQILADRLAAARGLDPDTSRYPFLYKVLAAKSIYV